MRMRPPATPLITIDPYFSVWSHSDTLTNDTCHWTGKSNAMVGLADIDGTDYRFMGVGDEPTMTQTSFDMDALSTVYVFEAAGVCLTCTFTSPVLLSDLNLLTRPVSYLHTKVVSLDGKAHKVTLSVSASEELCLNYRGQYDVETQPVFFEGIAGVKMGSTKQPVLEKKGDDIRIDWGYFYLTTDADNAVVSATTVEVPIADIAPEEAKRTNKPDMTFVTVAVPLSTKKNSECLFAFAYDDVKSILYFEDQLTSYWNKDGKAIDDAITEAFADYQTVKTACDDFSLRLFADAVKAGGEKYAELLELAYRSTIAAHKLVLDKNGEILWVSKECHSNGCAATVDVSYPSIPLFLLYNPELVRGMMRPVFRFARSDMWEYDFAPHDVGTYPHLTCQVYSYGTDKFQMPVEECGNMIVMAAAEAVASGDASFAEANMDLLEQWVGYLIRHGRDPENQLCTDDFAGHLAHNCNLSLKAISGIAGLGIIYDMLGRKADSKKMRKTAADMAADWAKRASNGDGSYRLAFDREGSWSMKYNIVWDKLWGTNLMPQEVLQSEFASYRRHVNAYGMPLDIRADYTKSDWLVWTATLAENRDDFENFVAPLWQGYNATKSRVVMTDWYDTRTGDQIGFRHRSVQGGLYIKLLEASGKMKR